MIDVGIAIVGGFFYLTGQYGFALLLILLAMISGAGAALMALVNPDWYFQKRVQAGLHVDILRPTKGITSLIVAKIILVAVLALIAWHIAGKAGYI